MQGLWQAHGNCTSPLATGSCRCGHVHMTESDAQVGAVAPAFIGEGLAGPPETVAPAPSNGYALPLGVMAIVTVAFALQWAQNFFIPVVVALLFA